MILFLPGNNRSPAFLERALQYEEPLGFKVIHIFPKNWPAPCFYLVEQNPAG